MKKPSIFLGIPVHAPLPLQTVVSIIETVSLLRSRGIVHELQFQSGGAVVENRNKLLDTYLKSDKSLFFAFDSDMVWRPEDVLKFYYLADKMDVICAAYPTKQDPPQFHISFVGSLIAPNDFGCFPIKGTGLGFTIIKREVVETLAKRAPMIKLVGYEERLKGLFRWEYQGETLVGEDMGFFADMRAAGYTVWLDPSISLGHVGTKTYTGSTDVYLDSISTPCDGPSSAAVSAE